MSAYLVFNYTITNPDAYQAYPPAAMPTLASSGAVVLVADYGSEAQEGSPGHVLLALAGRTTTAVHGSRRMVAAWSIW